LTQKKKQIGIDVSCLTFPKHATGIERVLVEINKRLISLLDPDEYEVNPFVTQPDFKRPTQLPEFLTKDPIFNKQFASIDSFDTIFFGGINVNLPMAALMRLQRERHVRIVSLVHDILPITHPDWFPVPIFAGGREVGLSSRNVFQIYLQSTFSLANHVVLVSQHVKNEIMRYKWNRLPEMSVLHLGAYELPVENRKIPHTGIKTIYVSTVTIRKGHAELLSAFELLWTQGVDISLTIVGNRGWLIDDFIERMTSHSAFGTKLFWRERLNDREVATLYDEADIAFIVSEDEGFGLVLEEGLANGVKVIARDIPIFRERDYKNLYFFSGGPKELSEKILQVAPIPFDPMPAGSIRTIDKFVAGLSDILRAV